MSEKKKTPQTIQIRISEKLPDSVYRWCQNQGTNVNEAAKTALQYFVMIYGEEKIDSSEMQIKLAKDLLLLNGETLPDISEPSVMHLKNLHQSNSGSTPTSEMKQVREEQSATVEEPEVKEAPKQEEVAPKVELKEVKEEVVPEEPLKNEKKKTTTKKTQGKKSPLAGKKINIGG